MIDSSNIRSQQTIGPHFVYIFFILISDNKRGNGGRDVILRDFLHPVNGRGVATIESGGGGYDPPTLKFNPPLLKNKSWTPSLFQRQKDPPPTLLTSVSYVAKTTA